MTFVLKVNKNKKFKKIIFFIKINFKPISIGHMGPLCESCDLYGDKWKIRYSKKSSY